MKTAAVIFAILLANQVAAQTAKERLEQAILIEEREFDLKAALTSYLVLAKDESIEASLRADTWLRVGRLYLRTKQPLAAKAAFLRAVELGGESYRETVAALQDPEGGEDRLLVMRKQARVLIKELARELNQEARPSEVFARLRNLKWLGRPAAIELVVAAEEIVTAKPFNYHKPLRVYLEQLWGIGGEELVAYADRVRSKPVEFRRLFALCSRNAQATESYRLAESLYDDEDPVVVIRLAAYPGYASDLGGRDREMNLGIKSRRGLPLVRLLDRKNPELRKAVLEVLLHWNQLVHEQGKEETLRALAPRLDACLKDPDPRVSRAANNWYLSSKGSRGSALGRRNFLSNFMALRFAAEFRMPNGIFFDCAASEFRSLVEVMPVVPEEGIGKDSRMKAFAILVSNRYLLRKTWNTDEFGLMELLIEKGWDRAAHGALLQWVIRIEMTDTQRAGLTLNLDQMHRPWAWIEHLASQESLPPEIARDCLAWFAKQRAEKRGPDTKPRGRTLRLAELRVLAATGSGDFAESILQRYREDQRIYPEASRILLTIAATKHDPRVVHTLRSMLIGEGPSRSRGATKETADECARSRNRVFEYLVSIGDTESIPLYAQAYSRGLYATPQAQKRSSIQPARFRRSLRGIRWLFAYQTADSRWVKSPSGYNEEDRELCLRQMLLSASPDLLRDLSKVEIGPALPESIIVRLCRVAEQLRGIRAPFGGMSSLRWALLDLSEDAPAETLAALKGFLAANSQLATRERVQTLSNMAMILRKLGRDSEAQSIIAKAGRLGTRAGPIESSKSAETEARKLGDPDLQQMVKIAERLTENLIEWSGPRTSPELTKLRMWAYRQPKAEYRIVAAMYAHDTPEEREIVHGLLDDKRYEVASSAFGRFLGEGGYLLSDSSSAAQIDAFLLEQIENRHFRIRSSVLGRLCDRKNPGLSQAAIKLARRHPENRSEAIELLGKILSVEAVPVLVEYLRDQDYTVRKQAKRSLDAIRYFHDEKQHWDKVFSGTETSSASAASDLLEQAKPDKAKTVRLMAIRSLATLAVAETLPFLIRYTQAKDPEIAKAARAAVTEINRKGLSK